MEFQVVQRRLPYPLMLESLPADFSEQAKFDREQGFIPVRITFLTETENEELFRNWPENRVPASYHEQDDVDAEGKYNPELYEAAISPILLDDTDERSTQDSDPGEDETHNDSPLLEF